MYFARMGNLMFISNLFIQTSLEPEMWIILLYPSQPTSGCIFHSLVQFQFIKFSSCPHYPKGEDGASLENNWTYVQNPSEKAAFFSISDEERTHQSPLPGISECTPGIHSNTANDPVCWDSSCLPVISISGSWHLPSPGFSQFCPKILGLFCFYSPLVRCSITCNFPSSCFSHRKSDLATGWPQGIPQEEST